MRVTLQDIYADCVTRDEATRAFKKLTSWMIRSRLEQMKKVRDDHS